jgi:hypothetical protein
LSILLDAAQELERERERDRQTDYLYLNPCFLFGYLASTKFCDQQASTYMGALDDCLKQASLPS